MKPRPLVNDGFDASRVVDRTRKIGAQLIELQVDRQSTDFGQHIAATAQAIRDVGIELQKRGQGRYVADVADAVAKYVDRIGTYLQESDASMLGHDFGTLARRRPVFVGALALAGGFVGSRVLRVSLTNRPERETGSDAVSKPEGSS